MMMLWEPLVESRFLSPARSLRAMQRELERWLELPFASGASAPPIALYSKENGLLLRSPMPGLEAGSLQLEVDGDVLTLSGEWPAESADKDGTTARRTERPRGRFTRTLRLPFEVDASEVQARLERGLLEVELPRAEKSRPIQIQVRSEDGTKKD